MSDGTTKSNILHILEQKDVDRLLGLCAKCGVVPIKRIRTGIYVTYRCANAAKENSQKSARNRKGSHGLRASEVVEFIGDKVCAICFNEYDQCVDHDHKSGKIRGVLCGKHNRAIGLFGDDPELLRRAADYLEGKIHVARSQQRPLQDGYFGPRKSGRTML